MPQPHELSEFVALDALPAVPPRVDPGCRHPPGVFEPVVDPRRCEGKAACVAVCPYDVFVVRRFARLERGPLGVRGTLRWWLNGGVGADPVGASRCHGCGLCVSACPEDAISLRRVEPAGRPG